MSRIDGFILRVTGFIIRRLEDWAYRAQWVERIEDAAYQREQARREEILRGRGWRIVTHSGGGEDPGERNLITDTRTGETLADLPGTLEAMDAGWQGDWFHEDRVMDDGWDVELAASGVPA